MPAFFRNTGPRVSSEISASEELAQKLQDQRLKDLEGLLNQPQPSAPSKPVVAETPNPMKEPQSTPALAKENPETAKPEPPKPETSDSAGKATDAATWREVSDTSFS